MPKNVNVPYIRQPSFYKNFHCIGNECPVNCCYGWGIISWKNKEYEKIKNADMSNALREKFESSFEPVTDEKEKNIFDYKIVYGLSGKCPMLDESGLCMIQKELGEEYLSHTCRGYPRKGHYINGAIMMTCHLSCVHVLDIICNDENCMVLENTCHSDDCADIDGVSDINDWLNYPAMKYEYILFDFFYELMSDRSRSIETAIVLGAMAAQKLDEFIKKGQADRIPEIIKALKPQLNNPVQIERLENAKPNLSLKGNIAAVLLKVMRGASIYQDIFENGIPSEEKWADGMKKWNDEFKDRPFVMRNIALNLFIAQAMPFRDKTYSLFENFSYFAAEMCVFKLLAAAVSVQFDNAEKMFKIAAANVDRAFSHDDKKVKTVIDILHTAGVNSPAYLMGILK